MSNRNGHRGWEIKHPSWDLPAFDDLIRNVVSQNNDIEQVSQRGNNDIPGKIKPPIEICKDYGFRVLLTDVSLISDKHLLPITAGPIGVSHILSELDDNNGSVLKCYHKALKYMANRTVISNEPIVAHRSLYKNTCVIVKTDRSLTKLPKSDLFSDSKAKWYRASLASKWEYELGNSSTDIKTQVAALADQFVLCMEDCNIQRKLIDVYRKSILVVVPLLRPDADSTLSGVSAEKNKLENLQPAGAVFIILAVNKEVKFSSNKFQKNIEYLAVDLQRVLLKVTLSHSHGQLGLMQNQARIYDGLGHTLKTAVQSTGWSQSIEQLRKLPSLDNEKNQFTIFRAINSLSLFAYAEGLGHLLRLFALLQRGEFKKLENWVDEELLLEWETGDSTKVLNIYKYSIEMIAQTLCIAQGWSVMELIVVNNGEEERTEWKYTEGIEQYFNFNLSRVGLPPFVYDNEDALFALIPAILEPIRNAIKYYKKNESTYTELPPLRLRLEGNLPEGILLSVGNDSVRPEELNNELPSGLKTTEMLLQQTEMATFANPIIQKHNETNATFWVPITIHPNRLANKIKSARR